MWIRSPVKGCRSALQHKIEAGEEEKRVRLRR